MEITREKQSGVRSMFFAGVIWLLALQNPLGTLWGPLSYIDELTALLGAVACAYEIVVVRRCRIAVKALMPGLLLLAYVMIGLAGNILYRFQPLKSVIVDLYTNVKFFLAIGTGYFLFEDMSWDEMKRVANRHARLIMLLLFSVFLADRFFDFFPFESRYGIKSATIFFSHPTYLAGASVFLIALLTIFFDKKNYPYLAMGLILMLFTLRSKCFAGAAVYVLLFVMFICFKYTLKWWHVVVAGLLCLLIGWPQIRFYFIELSGHSARSLLLLTSLIIMKDYFPIGTGFATYASSEAAKHYSPVYRLYGLHNYYELRDVSDIETALEIIATDPWLTEQYMIDPNTLYMGSYLYDSFWPVIFGQTGVLGTLVFFAILGLLVKQCLSLNRFHVYAYVGVLFMLIYLLICTMAEPAFHNAVSIPLALTMGIVFSKAKSVNTKYQ